MKHLLITETKRVYQPDQLVGTSLPPELGSGVGGVCHHFGIYCSVNYYNKDQTTLPFFTTSSQLRVLNLF